MKSICKKIFLWTVLILHISLIFFFSSQTADDSTVVSKGFTRNIKSEVEIKQELSQENEEKFKNEKYAEAVAKIGFIKLEGIIRKVAHFSLFFLLGVFINLLMKCYDISGKVRLVSSILFSGGVAFTDETIQLFSEGRSGMILDVFLDMSGAAVAAILFFVGGIMYEKIKRIKLDS